MVLAYLWNGLGSVLFYDAYRPASLLCLGFWNEEESLHNLEKKKQNKTEEPNTAGNIGLSLKPRECLPQEDGDPSMLCLLVISKTLKVSVHVIPELKAFFPDLCTRCFKLGALIPSLHPDLST